MLYLYTGGDAVSERGDVGDDADVFTGSVQFLQAADDVLEGVGIEGAEAFIEEEGVYAGGVGEAREPERQGKAYQEALTTGEVGGGAPLCNAELVVNDGEPQQVLVLAGAAQLIARGEFAQLYISLVEEELEGELLGIFFEAVLISTQYFFE